MMVDISLCTYALREGMRDPHLREEKGGFFLTSLFVCAILYFAGKKELSSVKESFRLKPHSLHSLFRLSFLSGKKTFQFSGRNNPACTKNVPRPLPRPSFVPFNYSVSSRLLAQPTRHWLAMITGSGGTREPSRPNPFFLSLKKKREREKITRKLMLEDNTVYKKENFVLFIHNFLFFFFLPLLN